MKIELGHADHHDFSVAIREQVKCGTCKSSTFVLWEKPMISERPRGVSLATIVTDDQGTEISIEYMVRCSFFKQNIMDPEHLIVCEGYKKKE